MKAGIILSASTARRIRVAVFIFYFIQGLCFSSWASRIPDIKMALGLNDASWGTVLLMIPLGQLIGMSLSGVLIPRIGSKLTFIFAMSCYTASLLAIGFCSSETLLLIGLLVFGFFGNFCNISVNTQGVIVEEYYGRSIMSSFHGGWSLAGLFGAGFGLVMTLLGVAPHLHFLLIALIVFIGLLLNMHCLQPDVEKDLSRSGKTAKHKPERFLFLLGIVGFCGMAAEGAMTDWNGIYLHEVVGVSEKLSPLGLAAYMITMASGRFVMDKIATRKGRKFVLQCCGACIFVGLLLSVVYIHPVVCLLSFMVIGFGTAGIVPTVYSVTGRKTKIATGTALTLVSSISFLGFLLGPPVIGYISHATNLRYSYALIGLFGVCIVWLASRLKVLKD